MTTQTPEIPEALTPWDQADVAFFKANPSEHVHVRELLDAESDNVQQQPLSALMLRLLHEFALCDKGPARSSFVVAVAHFGVHTFKLLALRGDNPNEYFTVDVLDRHSVGVVLTTHDGLVRRCEDLAEQLNASHCGEPTTIEADAACAVCHNPFVTGDIVQAVDCTTHGQHTVHFNLCAAIVRVSGHEPTGIGVFYTEPDLQVPELKEKYEASVKKVNVIAAELGFTEHEE